MPNPVHIVDIFHGDYPVDFDAMKDVGAVGVIIKASQGSGMKDARFGEFRRAALKVFGEGCVHSYHFLDGSDPARQIENYLAATDGMPGRWLDYEQNRDGHGAVRLGGECSLSQAVKACHLLAQEQGSFPGMYGSDKSLLGEALLGGHFTVCPLWLARYGHKPMHKCDLWQFQGGEINPTILIKSKALDLSTYLGGDGDACRAWMKSLAV